MKELSEVEQLKHKYSIKMILDVLEIPQSTYYRWKHKNNEKDKVTQKVIELCEDTIISPTVIAKLRH